MMSYISGVIINHLVTTHNVLSICDAYCSGIGQTGKALQPIVIFGEKVMIMNPYSKVDRILHRSVSLCILNTFPAIIGHIKPCNKAHRPCSLN